MKFETSQLQVVIGNSCKYSTSLTKRIRRIIETEHGLAAGIFEPGYSLRNIGHHESWPLIALTLTHAATSPRLVPSKCSTNFDTVPTRMAGRRRRMAASSWSVPAGSQWLPGYALSPWGQSRLVRTRPTSYSQTCEADLNFPLVLVPSNPADERHNLKGMIATERLSIFCNLKHQLS